MEKKQCDICKEVDLEEYIDGKTKDGPWANMCVECFKEYGVGLGLGRGQRYQLDPDYENKAYKKVEG